MSEQQQTTEQTENNIPQIEEINARDIKIGDKDFVLVIRPDLSTESFVPKQTDESIVANNTILGISFLLMSRDQEAVNALVEGFYAQIAAASAGPDMDLGEVLAQVSDTEQPTTVQDGQ